MRCVDVFVSGCVCDQRWLLAWLAVITVACNLNVALCMVVYMCYRKVWYGKGKGRVTVM